MPSKFVGKIFGLLKSVRVLVLTAEAHIGHENTRPEKFEKRLATAPPDPRCTTGANI